MFSLIIFLSRRSKIQGLEGPRILGVVADDATRYFLVIFTSHLVFEITVTLGRVSTIFLLCGYGWWHLMPITAGWDSSSSKLVSCWLSWVLLCSSPTLLWPVVFLCKFVLFHASLFNHLTTSFRFLPVMISRIVLSLRKAVDPQRDAWPHAESPRNSGTLCSMKFVRPRGGLSERGGNPSFGTYTEL